MTPAAEPGPQRRAAHNADAKPGEATFKLTANVPVSPHQRASGVVRYAEMTGKPEEILSPTDLVRNALAELVTHHAKIDAPAEGRAAAGRFDVADAYAPCWWDARSDPRQARLPGPGGRRLDPLQGKTPRARAETRASVARTPRSRRAEPPPGRVITCFDSEV